MNTNRHFHQRSLLSQGLRSFVGELAGLESMLGGAALASLHPACLGRPCIAAQQGWEDSRHPGKGTLSRT